MWHERKTIHRIYEINGEIKIRDVAIGTKTIEFIVFFLIEIDNMMWIARTYRIYCVNSSQTPKKFQ